MSAGFAEVLRQHARNPAIRQSVPEELEARLRDLLDACRAAWPVLDAPAEGFVRYLAGHLPDDGDLADCLARMHAPDLYLAWSCATGAPAALAAFDRAVLGQAAPVLYRMGLSASQVDEVVQVLRTKLLVADDHGQRPLMASYAGRGALVGWVRTAARRTALSLRRNMDERLDGDGEDRALDRLPLPADVELDYIKGRYQVQFKQAIEDAIATLDAEQLELLRLHYTDGLGIDRVAALQGVHRATAARRITAASDAVRAETRRLLHERLRLGDGELDSLAGLVQSRLHLSLGRLLGAP